MRDLHFMSSALASGPFTDYKALVCIFLAGGNDSNNLIIPTVAGEYTNYANIRTPVLAIPNADGSGATAQQLTKAAGGNYIDPQATNTGSIRRCMNLRRCSTRRRDLTISARSLPS